MVRDPAVITFGRGLNRLIRMNCGRRPHGVWFQHKARSGSWGGGDDISELGVRWWLYGDAAPGVSGGRRYRCYFFYGYGVLSWLVLQWSWYDLSSPDLLLARHETALIKVMRRIRDETQQCLNAFCSCRLCRHLRVNNAAGAKEFLVMGASATQWIWKFKSGSKNLGMAAW